MLRPLASFIFMTTCTLPLGELFCQTDEKKPQLELASLTRWSTDRPSPVYKTNVWSALHFEVLTQRYVSNCWLHRRYLRSYHWCLHLWSIGKLGADGRRKFWDAFHHHRDFLRHLDHWGNCSKNSVRLRSIRELIFALEEWKVFAAGGLVSLCLPFFVMLFLR